MMRPFFILSSLAFFCSLHSFGQMADDAPGKNIKSTRVEIVAYGDAGDSTPRILSSVNEFDVKGRNTRSEDYRKNVLLMNEPTDSSSQIYYDYIGNAYSNEAAEIVLHGYAANDSILFEDSWGPSYFVTDGHDRTTYSYDQKGRLTEEKRFDGNKLTVTFSYTYAADGRLLMMKRTPTDVTLFPEKTVYHYDKSGNIISVASRLLSGELDDSTVYLYDANNRRTCKLRWEDNTKLSDSLVIVYNADGKVEQEYKPDAWSDDTPIGWRYHFKKYDADGKMQLDVEATYMMSTIKQLPYTKPYAIDSTKYEWWPDGKLKSAIGVRTKDGKRSPKSEKTYDKDGNILDDLLYDNTGLWIGYRYTYDGKGRKIKEESVGYGHQNGYSTFSYNEKDFVSEQRDYTVGGHLLDRRIFQYTFY